MLALEAVIADPGRQSLVAAGRVATILGYRHLLGPRCSAAHANQLVGLDG